MEKLASNQYLLVQSRSKEDRYDINDASPERYTRFSCPNPQCARFNRPGEGKANAEGRIRLVTVLQDYHLLRCFSRTVADL